VKKAIGLDKCTRKLRQVKKTSEEYRWKRQVNKISEGDKWIRQVKEEIRGKTIK
jgi:hypothetical protein